MRAAWSFWSRPFNTYYGHIWCKPLHHLLAWGLSVRTAMRHYPESVLVTDAAGKRLLIDQLGLPFTHVSIELDQLRDVDPGWWALGKLVAYGVQDQPFVHLDSDVFLWKQLPLPLLDSPVFTQNPEDFRDQDGHYRPQDIEWAFGEHSLSLPIEWQWARTHRSFYPAENCGIFGGSHLEFIRYYARAAVDLVTRPQHAAAWSRLQDKRGYSVVLEQFFLSACAEFHKQQSSSPYQGVRIDHLFPSGRNAFDPNDAARTGFTHLIGGAKTHEAVGRRLEERMRREDSDYFRRCEQVLAKGQAGA